MKDIENLTSADLKRMAQIEYISLLQAEKAIRIEADKLYDDYGGFIKCPDYPDAEEKNDLWLHLQEVANYLKAKRFAILDKNGNEIPNFIREAF